MSVYRGVCLFRGGEYGYGWLFWVSSLTCFLSSAPALYYILRFHISSLFQFVEHHYPSFSVVLFHLDSRLKLPLLHFIFFQLFLLFIYIFWKFSSIDSQSPFLLFFLLILFPKTEFWQGEEMSFWTGLWACVNQLPVYFYRNISFHLSLKMCSYIPGSMLYLCLYSLKVSICLILSFLLLV